MSDLNHGEPSEEKIKELKAKHADRSLHLVTLKQDDDEGGSESHAFVMTGPSRAEYLKFQEELEAAKSKKTDTEKGTAVRDACERSALALIRWPERPVVAALFERYTAMPLSFAPKIHDMAGDSFEVRTKKL